MTRGAPVVLAFAVAAVMIAAVPATLASATDQRASAPSPTTAPITVVIPELSPSPTPSSSSGGGNNGGGNNGGNNGGGSGGGSNGGGHNPDGSPVPPADPGQNKPGLTLDHKTIQAHEFMIASGSGYTPGEKVQLVLYPGAVVIGSKKADANGRISMRFRIPDDARPGVHVAEATGWDSGFVANKEFTVTSSVMAGGIPVLWWVIFVVGVLLTALVSTLLYFRFSLGQSLGGATPQGSPS